MDVRPRPLFMPMDWMSEQWQRGVIERASTAVPLHEALVVQGHLDLQHVQIDEIRVKGYRMIAWMGMAIMVSTRLWRAGSGESRARSNAGRSCVAPSSRLLPAIACDPGLYRWVGSLRAPCRRL